MNITDEQWKIVEPHLPEGKSGKGKRGRPAIDFRAVLNGILWILRTGAPWHDLPNRYPPYQTCHRRFQEWVNAKVMQAILTSLWADLRDRGGVKDIEGFIDGNYVPVKKKETSSASAVPAMRQRSWQLQTAMVFHSLSLLPLEIDMKQSSLTQPWKPLSLTTSQGNLSETKLTTVLLLLANSTMSEELS
jgi:transposase